MIKISSITYWKYSQILSGDRLTGLQINYSKIIAAHIAFVKDF